MNDGEAERQLEVEDFFTKEILAEESAKIRFGSIIGAFFGLLKPNEKVHDAS